MKSLNENVKNWYCKAYPTDDLGEEINEKITFKSVISAINKGQDVYNTIHVSDSLVRERIFGRISELTEQPYDNIYDAWIGNGTPKFIA